MTTPPIVTIKAFALEMLHTKTVMALVLSVIILIAIAPITNAGMKCHTSNHNSGTKESR